MILHGANGSASEMTPLIERLSTGIRVFAPNMIGHGGRDVPERLDIEEIADDLLRQCDVSGIGQAHWFGFSFGGLIASWIAAHRPERVLSLATLVAKIFYDRAALSHVIHLLDPERLARPGNPRQDELARAHAPQDWRQVARANRTLFESFAARPPLREEAVRTITQPALVMAGLEDPLVSGTETKRLADMMPNGVPGLFPGSCHPLRQAPLPTIVRTLERFVAGPEKFVRTARVDLLKFRWDRPAE